MNYGLVGLFVVAYGWLSYAVYPKTGPIGVVSLAPPIVAPVLALWPRSRS